jgi:hypothetical protein
MTFYNLIPPSADDHAGNGTSWEGAEDGKDTDGRALGFVAGLLPIAIFGCALLYYLRSYCSSSSPRTGEIANRAGGDEDSGKGDTRDTEGSLTEMDGEDPIGGSTRHQHHDEEDNQDDVEEQDNKRKPPPPIGRHILPAPPPHSNNAQRQLKGQRLNELEEEQQPELKRVRTTMKKHTSRTTSSSALSQHETSSSSTMQQLVTENQGGQTENVHHHEIHHDDLHRFKHESNKPSTKFIAASFCDVENQDLPTAAPSSSLVVLLCGAPEEQLYYGYY